MDSLADNEDSGKTPFMRLWINDWQSGVMTMTAAQRGAHISMLCYAWERGGCPTDLRLLKRITGEIEEDDLLAVLKRWTVDNDQYINKRQEKERRKVRYRHERAVANAHKRWSNATEHANTMLENMQTSCESDAAQSLRVSESQSLRVSESQSSESQKHNQPRRLRAQSVSARSAVTFDFATATFAGITDDTIARWTAAYPAVDVPRTILQSAEWLAANPKQRKKNYSRFLTNWFGRTQERGGNRLPTHNTPNAVPEHLRF